MNAWTIELVVVRGGSYSAGERRALTRDVDAGRLRRIRQGVYVDRAGFESLDDRARHIVAMRALTAVSPDDVTFSHWSAAVLHGLPFLGSHLDRVHVTVRDDASLLRRQQGVAAHVLPHRGALEVFGPLLATEAARTAVDIAAAETFDGGVVVADAVLSRGVPRWALEAVLELDPRRRGAARAATAIAFGHPGGESAAESVARCTEFRIGIPPLVLQHAVVGPQGRFVHLDQYSREADAGVEIDGLKKYLDPALAKDGTARALLAEKRRQDAVLLEVARMARFGWREANSAALLAPILAKVGIVRDRARATREHYAEVAAAARPRLGTPAARG